MQGQLSVVEITFFNLFGFWVFFWFVLFCFGFLGDGGLRWSWTLYLLLEWYLLFNMKVTIMRSKATDKGKTV